jgi:hypothetical protein
MHFQMKYQMIRCILNEVRVNKIHQWLFLFFVLQDLQVGRVNKFLKS